MIFELLMARTGHSSKSNKATSPFNDAGGPNDATVSLVAANAVPHLTFFLRPGTRIFEWPKWGR
jgi:hypothetical protein